MAGRPFDRTDRELLRRIRDSGGEKAGYKQLVRELGLGGGAERRELREQLARLVKQGALAELEEGIWGIPRPPRQTKQPFHERIRPGALEEAVRSGRDRLVSGRLDLHRDGFGFVRADRGEDIFIAPNEIHGAMQGDLVLVDEHPPGRDGRRSGRIARVLTRRNPTVVGVFHYSGHYRRRKRADRTPESPGNYVRPFDERIGTSISIPDGAEIVIPSGGKLHRTLGEEALASVARWEPEDPDRPLEGLAVDVEITHFPSAGRPAQGRVIEVLGPPEAFGVDVEIVIRKHHIPHAFPASVLAEAEERAGESVSTLPPEELARREDFRALPIVTIDGETAKDFDDAVLVRPLPNGNTELQVHIADVSWYVRTETALDTEARVRGTSVYFPDRAVPMLPHALSSGMCSLLPQEDRLVLSCIMEVDPRGEIAGYRVAEGMIRSARRCTYTSVQQCLNAGGSQSSDILPEPAAEDIVERERVQLENPGLPEAMDAMLELALRLNRKRVRRGSIDFDLPEPVVEFDPDGNMKAIVRSERGWAHRLIEEFMLSANECVATWLASQGIPSIYRIHEVPDPKRIVEFEETAAQFGQTLGIANLPVKRFTMKSDRREGLRRSARGREQGRAQGHEVPDRIPVTPQMYQKLVRRISGTPEERILSYLMLRSLKQARYAEKNEGHFALASPSYTHFTSPIRRYPDLIVHRLVRAMLRSGAGPTGGAIVSTDPQPWGEKAGGRGQRDGATKEAAGPYAAEELSDIAAESSQAERRAADAERELIEGKKIRFMQDRIGEDFEGIILSVTKYGFFVELNEMFIEGLVPIHSLPGDYYTFRDTDRTICGARSGHCFAIGQKVHVLLDRIDREQRRLQFALLPGTEPKAESLRKPKAEKPTKPRKPSGKEKSRLRNKKKGKR